MQPTETDYDTMQPADSSQFGKRSKEETSEMTKDQNGTMITDNVTGFKMKHILWFTFRVWSIGMNLLFCKKYIQ